MLSAPSTLWSSANSWATTSGGAGSDNNFPLAQDTAVIDNNTSLTGTLSTGTLYNIGSLDASQRTNAITLNYGNVNNFYGSYTLGSGVTVTGASVQTFAGRGTMIFTSAGKTITFPITVDASNSTFQLGDALNITNVITHTRGTFNANNYNLTCNSFTSTSGNTRTLTMGSGLWTLTGTGTVWNISATGLTLNKDTANILLSDVSTSSRTFAGATGLSYNKLTIGGTTGTSTTNIIGSSSFTELDSTKTVAHTITLSSSLSTIDKWSVKGTLGNVVTINSSIAGTRRYFALALPTEPSIDYLSVTDIGETSGNKFYVGTNSTNGGNNSNVYFSIVGNMLMFF